MDKKTIRLELLHKRKSLDKVTKAKNDIVICKSICDTTEFKNAENVLIFAPAKDEFDVSYIVERCREQHKRVYYPRCTDKEGNMKFCKVDGFGDLSPGMYGILEPKPTCREYTFHKDDIVIVPCLSVDRHFNRLGYGKGYYDRFLKEFQGVSICPCYSEMFSDELPTDEFDIKINIIVTDKEVIR